MPLFHFAVTDGPPDEDSFWGSIRVPAATWEDAHAAVVAAIDDPDWDRGSLGDIYCLTPTAPDGVYALDLDPGDD